MRLFVAVDLSDEARAAVAAEQRRIASALAQSGGGLTLVRSEHLHVTLLFLGEVPETRGPAVAQALNIAVGMPSFDMTLGGAGVFPPRGAPRALWVGLIEGAAALSDLRGTLAGRIGSLDLPIDPRPFAPHLTLARWRRSRSSDRVRALAAAPPGGIARVRVERATLYHSRLSSAGPTYTPLAHATLTGRTRG